MTEFVTVLVFSLCSVACVLSLTADPQWMSFDRLYTQAISAYEDERWFQCVSFMSRAIEEKAVYSETLYKCRLQCKSGRDKHLKDIRDSNKAHLFNLSFYQDLILNLECVRRCKKKNVGDRHKALAIFNRILNAFDELKPYDYLQICAFKTNDIKQAVAAAYTFFLANPTHKDMINNLQYYRSMPGVVTEDFINLEEKPFQTHYIAGVEAYGESNWPLVVEQMELALEEFFSAEERCRLECEGLPDLGQPGEDTDLLNSIADLYSSLLRCQLGCEDRLGVIHSQPVPDYLADHYHYLQYAYFKLKNYEKAAGAAESYLLYKPDDDIMLNNKLYYLKRGYGESFFVARKEAVEYWERKSLTREILRFVDGAPWYDDDTDDTYNVYIKKNVVSMGEYGANQLQSHYTSAAVSPFIQHFERLGIKVFADGEVLHGPERFAADGLMTPEQCQELIYLSQSKYDGAGSLPTLQQVNIPQAVELVKKEKASDASLRILLRASEVSRFFAQKYLNLTKLYLHSTRLICRDHTDLASDEKDCYIQEDGTCLRWFPIDDQADYVGAIHLNKLMTGGEIYVANENLDGQGMMLPPKCGRMIGFPSKVPHGILPFQSGMRCALVFGYTKNRTKDEKSHSHAFRYLDKLEGKKQEEHVERLSNRKSVLQEIKDAGISVTMSEEDLAGEERVVADHLLSAEDCELLDGLAKNGALRGDGYGVHRYNIKSSISPHTKHEMFQGLTVLRAAQLANLGEVEEKAVEMYLNMSEKSRDFVEKYFNLESPLYFDFTHLVCRRAIENVTSRDDLSHPVHADNCILQEDQSCIRQFPAYTQRDYSALLYLNDDFEGGDFFFAHANKTKQVSVRPRCGRLVGFNAAAYHGVTAVTKGERCALAMWYTLDPDFKEIAHIQAKKMLRDRKRDPNYSLPSFSPLFTMPGINPQEGVALPGRPNRIQSHNLEKSEEAEGSETNTMNESPDKVSVDEGIDGAEKQNSQIESAENNSPDESQADESQSESSSESNEEDSSTKISQHTSSSQEKTDSQINNEEGLSTESDSLNLLDRDEL